ncbi:MAG: RNA polymerase sigma factor [Actinobacteria bacterium]|nr:RNA polymerase sigma factor [Actinomycetota bacterium]
MIKADRRLESDAELIGAALDDPDSFRVLYDRYAERLHAFFMRRTGSGDVAVDLTAETFARAWASRRRFRDQVEGSAAPWLFAIARRVLIKCVSRRRLETTILERLQVDLRSSDQARVTPDERWLDGLDTDVAAALHALPCDQRQAIELRVVGELPYARIASRLGCTPTAVRIRVSRGLATLRARLEGIQG